MTGTSRAAGIEGETVANWMLPREGFRVIDRQVDVDGHRLDFAAIHVATGIEWLVEVKTWGVEPSGKDTVKKAIADAYDLRQCGESRPIMLVLSHYVGGLLGRMLRRAIQAGAINEIRVIGSTNPYLDDDTA
jgi:hypothetical protein